MLFRLRLACSRSRLYNARPLPKIGAAALPPPTERIGGKAIPLAIKGFSRDCSVQSRHYNRHRRFWFQAMETVRLRALPYE
jgi:hypothetical protein